MALNREFINKSLETHLFFSRIMKEHSLFLQLSFVPKDKDFISQADIFQKEFTKLLSETVTLSKGIIRQEVLQSGEFFTQYTLNAELATSYFTGADIDTEITQAEFALLGQGNYMDNPNIEQQVIELNKKALDLTSALIQFKSMVLNNVMSCKMFTSAYPLMVQHDMQEARHYVSMIQGLQSNNSDEEITNPVQEEIFWNDKMGEHAKFIRGLLDPSEKELINIANNFSKAFEKLSKELKSAQEMKYPLQKLTEDSLNATTLIRNFKERGTQGILDCKIKSIIIPLLSDHVLREANHYIRELNTIYYEEI